VIDLLLITHPDRDHTGGFESISDRFRVGRVGIPSHFRFSEDLAELLEAAEEKRIDVVWIESPSIVSVDGLELILRSAGPGSDNDGSLALLVKAGDGRAVMTGDASSASEQELIPMLDWQAEVLVVGHHGSNTSLSSEWLSEVRPRHAVISCGRGNSYGHPHPKVLARLDEKRIETHRTDTDGTVSFRLGSAGFEPTN
jgi:beta-lactamase superfamily II metal-dependent hydrolase